MTAKGATIYFRRGKVLIDSLSKTDSGFWIGTGPVQVVEANDTSGIASALRSAFAVSRPRVPAPPPWEDLTGQVLSAAGVKSWRTFVKDTKCVGAQLVDGKVTLTPDQKVDRIGNYVPLTEKARTVRLDSDALGQAVIDTFEDAQ